MHPDMSACSRYYKVFEFTFTLYFFVNLTLIVDFFLFCGSFYYGGPHYSIMVFIFNFINEIFCISFVVFSMLQPVTMPFIA